jgi:hypothetical protein
MFANFNLSLFPIVIIEFDSSEINDKNFQLFLDNWEKLYLTKKDFTLVFDTTNMSIPNLKYCFKMSMFIKKIRKFNPQYLKKSIINVKNNTITNMLEFIFYLQPPVAPVYITQNEINNIIENIETSDNLEYIDNNKLNTINIIKPDKPFLPFL